MIEFRNQLKRKRRTESSKTLRRRSKNQLSSIVVGDIKRTVYECLFSSFIFLVLRHMHSCRRMTPSCLLFSVCMRLPVPLMFPNMKRINP